MMTTPAAARTGAGLAGVEGKRCCALARWPFSYVYEYELFLSDTVLRLAQDPLGELQGGIGATIWDSALLLAAYLQRSVKLNGKNVVDLGAGTGILGILAAALGASKVVLTDQANAMPLLRHNVHLNSALVGNNVSLRTRAMQWGNKQQLQWVLKELDGADVDVVLASELVYWPELFDELIETLHGLCSATTIVLIAYEERSAEKERKFFDTLSSAFEVSEVPSQLLDTTYQAPELHLFLAKQRIVF